MPFERLILKELNCPRCNAIAQLRIEEKRADTSVVYIVCSKCKLQKYQGLFTRKAVNLVSYQRKLESKLEFMKDSRHKRRLEKELRTIPYLISEANKSVGG